MVKTPSLNTVQDFLIKLGIKPPMNLLERSIFSLDNFPVRPTHIMNRANKKLGTFLEKKVF